MKVAAVQYCGQTDAKAAGLVDLAALVRQCEGAELIVLPELAATGYLLDSPEAAQRIAESPQGPLFQALSPAARDTGAWVVAGFVEAAGKRLYNSALVLDPSGTLQWVYRKTLLFEADLPWATPGDSGYRVFETAGGGFTVGICMDLNDDRFTAWVRACGARAIAFPTNWLDDDDDSVWRTVWEYWAWRLEGASAALVAANTYGSEGDIAFCGCSAVLDRRVLRAHTSAEGTAIVRATLPPLHA